MSIKKIKVGDITCGADELFLISGPCVIEDEMIMMKTAEKLKEVSAKLNIPIIYKSSFLKDNRSNLKYYDGPGLVEGMKTLAKIKEQFGFTLLTDIHYPDQAAPVAEVCDVLQIPAYLCMQSGLMVAAAKTGRVINIKHGQFLAPDNMKHPVGKCLEAGTHAIRKYGIPSADAKGGAREFLPVLGRAGVASGVDGIFVETHPEPEKALCDAASQLSVYALEEFLKPLIELHALEVKYR